MLLKSDRLSVSALVKRFFFLLLSQVGVELKEVQHACYLIGLSELPRT